MRTASLSIPDGNPPSGYLGSGNRTAGGPAVPGRGRGAPRPR